MVIEYKGVRSGYQPMENDAQMPDPDDTKHDMAN